MPLTVLRRSLRVLPAAAIVAAPALAQSITVVANRNFRPTPVLLPRVAYTVASDSADGSLVLRDLTVNPVTFAGTVRIEGIEPQARGPERRVGLDTVRFDSDGRVVLSVGNGAGRPHIGVEVEGSRAAPGGRIVVTGRAWSLTRVLLVTVAPADLHEHRWRSVGYGIEDRIRVDDRARLAFLSDTSAGPTTVAIGFNAPAQGRIQSGTMDLLVPRRFADQTVPERRRVGTLTMIIQPATDAAGNFRVELVFGVGTSEQEAAQAAQLAAASPATYGPGAAMRVSTPAADASLLLAHLFGAARPMLDYDRIAGLRHTPAGSYTFLAAFDRDGWYGALTALQLGDADAVCAEYALFRRYADAGGAQRHEIWNRLGRRGAYVWTDDWGGRWMGDKDPYQVLKGYACYRATRDAAWLTRELPVLRRLGRFILDSDRDGDGLVEGGSYITYSEMNPLDAAHPDSVYRTEDPYVNALAAFALDRLGELEAAAGLPDSAATWGTAASRIRVALPALWRPALGWFAYHARPDGRDSWDRHHLQPIDAVVFGGVTDTAMAQTMVAQLLRSDWWDASARGFYAVPINDPWHDLTSYWRGWGWHILDFKALHASFAAGTPGQRRLAWERFTAEVTRIVRSNYGRPGERGDNNGLFMFSAGAYLDLLARGLFGVDERLDQVEVMPHVDGIADDFTWRLDGWRLAGDTLSVHYRPADRAATIRLTALTHKRIVVTFPWFGPAGCVTARRGPDTERLTPVFLRDGSAYVDVRGAFDPAEIRVSAACAGG
jgi:hypothetical protein